MGRIILVVVLLLPWPVRAQDISAEKLFRDMEKKIGAAKSLEMTFVVEVAAAGLKVTGKAQFAQDQLFRIDAELAAGGKSSRMLFVSDGKTIYNKDEQASRPKTWPARPGDADRLRAQFARAGVFAALTAFADEVSTEPGKDFDVEKRIAAADFKLGRKETVGGRDTQMVEGTLTYFKRSGAQVQLVAKMAVDIDTRTHLPVKRTTEVKFDKEILPVTETYPTITLEPRIDAKRFDVPK